MGPLDSHHLHYWHIPLLFGNHSLTSSNRLAPPNCTCWDMVAPETAANDDVGVPWKVSAVVTYNGGFSGIASTLPKFNGWFTWKWHLKGIRRFFLNLETIIFRFKMWNLGRVSSTSFVCLCRGSRDPKMLGNVFARVENSPHPNIYVIIHDIQRLQHKQLYHLESRWRNSHALVYHGPLLSYLLGVAPSTFTTV